MFYPVTMFADEGFESDAEGRRRQDELVHTLQRIGGVVAVRSADQLE